ncbi:MAG TPA: UDP-3-O-acyl-N-acetylglucosamine deacetylase [Desulfobulbales bacterium]|jgi:UDP-3-O-[3-hydroxymyristoyl] N-acetylglucosamine deacetylase|nr:UDP-3-O-acyl-N-acetylglucosamine deacetylase [Desulfobulbales bacterium]
MKTFSQISPYQSTIRKAVHISGVGLHSGDRIKMTLSPAGANSGIRFVRKDLDTNNPVPAFMNRVVDTTMATTISEGNASIATTEHLLAAINGLSIDNIIIEVDGPEVPIMDGSSAPFVNLLLDAGIRQQKSYRRLVKITREISFRDSDRHISIYPYDGFKVTAEINFTHDTINRQVYSVAVTPRKFVAEICRARTFGFLEDVKKLQENGLALGASLDNAVGMDQHGVLNREGLRYDNEFVRHKIVDIIGDMTLLGCPVLGHIVAYKSGHSQHLKLMETIAATPDAWEFVELKKGGQLSVLNKFVSRTKEAGNRFLPILAPVVHKRPV